MIIDGYNAHHGHGGGCSDGDAVVRVQWKMQQGYWRDGYGRLLIDLLIGSVEWGCTVVMDRRGICGEIVTVR